MKKKFPYNLQGLNWDNEHNTNLENKYCYCGKGLKSDQPMIRCESCKQLFHRDCLTCMDKPLLFGDIFGVFHCSVCNQGEETFERKPMSWVTIVHLTIYNLIKNAQIDNEKKPKKDRREHLYFRWKDDVCAFIDDYWEYFTPGKQRSITWHNTIASVLSTHGNIFLSGMEKFHQSAWWTLHEISPPTGEKKSKMAGIRKPTVRKPLKRSRPSVSPAPVSAPEATTDVDDEPITTRRAKRLKKDKAAEENIDLDAFDMSSLSELSSADEASTDDEAPKKKKVEKQKPSILQTAVQKKPDEQRVKPTTADTQKTDLNGKGKPSTERRTSTPLSTTAIPNTIAENPPPSPKKPSAILPNKQATSSVSSQTENISSLGQNDNIPTSSAAIVKVAKSDTLPSQPSTPLVNNIKILTSKDEWFLLQKLEHSSKKLPPAARRYKRKLAVRRLKRSLGIKLFDMDHHVLQLLRTQNHALEPISTETVIKPASNQHVVIQQDDQQQLLDKITCTPYASSFASRLYGSIRQCHTITRDEPWLSSWNGRKLRPFIRRDFETKPKRMLLMGQIKACQGKPVKKGEPEPLGVVPGESIDYVYFQKEHLVQVNALLCRSFWEGIDASESLLFPEFSIVALYKRHVIGCAFMTPEAYITYFAVDPGWRNANIGQFMLYHLFQTSISKDITLHVSANNNAMILYQKFGFKPEEFIVNFYDKYYPADSVYSKNAFFLRLRR